MTLFRDLLRISSQFVEKQKGYWDHTAWLSLLKDAQEKGVQLTADMQTYLGTIVQSMKKIYETSSFKQGFGKGLSDITKVMYEQTVSFVEQTKGKWDHEGWEGFLKDLQKMGITITEEGRAYLGELLEAARKFYVNLPTKGDEVISATDEASQVVAATIVAAVAATVENPESAKTVTKAVEKVPEVTEKKPRGRKPAAPKVEPAAKKTAKTPAKSPGRKKTAK
ncbi:hypothetical protein [Candidatus Magnetomonas plexicatena]|uniref:hypothetical protein n=1 Tax=Candidatus Magnetomonas plexicatena TaxID=2552947 RepID=UPI0011010974|nr:hypothetical protein E2O03_001580 [Nitrospirales bacterium LBB_01]